MNNYYQSYTELDRNIITEIFIVLKEYLEIESYVDILCKLKEEMTELSRMHRKFCEFIFKIGFGLLSDNTERLLFSAKYEI